MTVAHHCPRLCWPAWQMCVCRGRPGRHGGLKVPCKVIRQNLFHLEADSHRQTTDIPHGQISHRPGRRWPRAGSCRGARRRWRACARTARSPTPPTMRLESSVPLCRENGNFHASTLKMVPISPNASQDSVAWSFPTTEPPNMFVNLV
jgi:hypothetical protein